MIGNQIGKYNIILSNYRHIYDALNDIWNNGYDIYVYQQDIEHLYSYLMSIDWYYIMMYFILNIWVYMEVNVILNNKYIQIWW